jgi:hypothetical protein
MATGFHNAVVANFFDLTLRFFFIILSVLFRIVKVNRFEVSIYYGHNNRTRDFAAIGFLPGRISS